MKKTLLLSAALSASLLAGEYGFRDYLTDYFKKNGGSMDYTSLDDRTTVLKHDGVINGTMDKYCVLAGGTLYGKMKHDLGEEQLPSHDAELISSYASMTKDERAGKLLSDSRVGGLFLTSEEKAFTANLKNFSSLECKLPNGNILMSGKIKGQSLIVEHKPEALSDFIWFNGRAAGNETSNEYKKRMMISFPSYESYFNTFKATHKMADSYRINDKINQKKIVTGFSSLGDIGEMNLFCEANGGSFTKDAVPFREFLKGVFNKNGWSVFADSANKVTSPFSGNYSCNGGKAEFSVLLENPYVWNNGDTIVFGYSKISKGRDAIQISGKNSTGGSAPQPGNSGTEEEQIILQISSSKVPFGKLVGANVISGYYNGTDAQGCDMVSLQKTVANMPVNKARKDTYNYKVCNGQVIALGETGLPGVPRSKELDPIIAQVKTQCKAYGAFGTEYQGTIVSCRTLDQNHCNLEINIMKDGKLIDKRVERTCK